MPKYRVELDNNEVHEVEVDAELPDTPQSRALLQHLVNKELRQAEEAPPFQPPPSTWWTRLGSKIERGIGQVLYPETHTYRIETMDGKRYTFELDGPLPAGEAGQQYLRAPAGRAPARGGRGAEYAEVHRPPDRWRWP
jgi:hypothetical protein